MRVKGILIAAVLVGGLGGYAWSALPPAAFQPSNEREAIEHSVYYPGCREARAVGKAPIYAGQPGYREGLDGDGDGVACEPYRGT